MASPIDKVFEEIFGHSPKKNGTAFEQLAAIATHIINGGEVKHDDKLRGEFSKTLYQLDVHNKTDSTSLMGEAKDYTIRNEKVGRGDLQKLGGALPDLKNIDVGAFFSATGYTGPAKKYAKRAHNITGKPISLYGLRPSTEVDELGRIKTIVININVIEPQLQNTKLMPHITTKGQEVINVLLKDGEEYKADMHYLYDENGNKKLSINELISQCYGDINKETNKTHASYILKDHYISVKGVLVEIQGLEYEIPCSYYTETIRISDDSENRLALLDGDGKVLQIITDKKLREYEFDEDGNLKKK